MELQVFEYDDFNGIRRADLIYPESALPYSLWVGSYLAVKSSKENTTRNSAYQLRYLIKYFSDIGIDLVERVESGILLSDEELDNAINTFKYFVDSQPIKYKKSTPRLTSTKNISNLIFTTKFSESKVSVQTVKARLRELRKFVEYLFINIHKSGIQHPPKELVDRYDFIIYQLKEAAKDLSDDNEKVKDPFEQSIPSEKFFELLEVTQPSHERNPWSKVNRFRNHIIFQIFIETGMRLGSLCKLKISDIRDNDKPRLLVTRSPNDKSDNRSRRPQTKTRPHASAISQELMNKIESYIESQRAQYGEAHEHDFIFVSHKKNKGKPIATNTVNAIIRKLSSVVDFYIHPHLLRYKWNEVFDAKATLAGFSSEQINDLRKYACGWSEKSEMARIYNEYRHATIVAEISRLEQEKTVPDIKR